jgi:hypothetical protein
MNRMRMVDQRSLLAHFPIFFLLRRFVSPLSHYPRSPYYVGNCAAVRS